MPLTNLALFGTFIYIRTFLATLRTFPMGPGPSLAQQLGRRPPTPVPLHGYTSNMICQAILEAGILTPFFNHMYMYIPALIYPVATLQPFPMDPGLSLALQLERRPPTPVTLGINCQDHPQ